ncbi:MAG TPA: hypothetical protein VGM18_04905 [Candidatus Sulfotelmatobacter sp.]|jgi:hypothetical protein
MKWLNVEPSSGTFVWTKLDEVVNTLAPGQGMKVFYTVGATPIWATACNGQPDPGTCFPGPTASGYGGGTQCASAGDGSCLPPSDVNADGTGTDAQFQSFISTVMNRYTTKIAAIETWNEQDSPNFWCPGGTGAVAACGTTTASLSRAVRMAWDLYKIAHCANASIQVIGPSFHGFSSGLGGWMNLYANTSISAPAGSINGCNWSAQTVTGAETFDVTNDHMRGTPNSDPTQIIQQYNAAVGEITRDSLPTALWNGEWGPVSTSEAANSDILAAYVAIEYVLQASFSNPPILTSVYYTWDAHLGLGLQGNVAATAYDTVAKWLIGSTVNAATVTGSIYKISGTNASGTAFRITFDTSQSCGSGCSTSPQTETGYGSYLDLQGLSHNISGTAPVGLKPILLLASGATSTVTGSIGLSELGIGIR